MAWSPAWRPGGPVPFGARQKRTRLHAPAGTRPFDNRVWGGIIAKPSGPGRSRAMAQMIWQVFDDIMSSVADEELRRLPRDGAEKHDQYLYGERATGSHTRDKP